MPSFIIPGAGGLSSGGANLLANNYFSGRAYLYGLTDIQLKADPRNSGFVYIAFSGGVTITSGGMNTSGLPNNSGLMDGMQVGPGDAYSIPKAAFPYQASGNPGCSGNPQLFAVADAAGSGQCRLYMEAF